MSIVALKPYYSKSTLLELFLSFLVLAIFLFSSISCNQKVDCSKLGDKVYECRNEFKQKLSSPVKKLDKTKLKQLLDKKLVAACKHRNGKVGDAKLLNRCLNKEKCGKFVDCILNR